MSSKRTPTMKFLLFLLLFIHANIAHSKKNIIENYENLDRIWKCSSETTHRDYSKNSISVIYNETFSDCIGLQSIKLGHNKINSIESGSFWILEDLSYLVLSHNRISYLDRNIFENNRKLRTVILSHNPLVVPQLISSSLQNLLCDFCKRAEVDEDTFAAIPNVQTISLVGTNVLPFNVKGLAALHSLQEFIVKDQRSKECFQKHEYPTLVQLQQNNVTLGPDVFCKVNDCTQTKHLLDCRHKDMKAIDPVESSAIITDYSHNSISIVKNGSFISQHNLRILILSQNSITHIETDAFRTLRDLKYIDLSHNLLETIQNSIFADNKNLLTVELSYNSITVPHLQSDSLETLVCDFCKQIVVEENSFSSMSNLTALRVLGTEVLPFGESAAKTLHHLREFVLTRNDSARCFPEEDYPGLLYLQKRGVILGDDVFCKRTTDTTINTTNRPPDIKNSASRSKDYFVPLLACLMFIILKYRN